MHPYHARRNSKQRLAAITEYLGDREGFTVLELGALDGYFSKHLAETHKAQCTAVDDNPHLQESPGVTVVQDRLSATAIRKLGPFDVALCLSVLHHLPQWKATLNALLDAAPVVIVESAHPDEALPKAGNHKASADILAAIENAGGVAVAEHPGYDQRYRRSLFVIDRTEPEAEADSGDLLESPPEE